jgi:hypothetical protein
VLESGVHRAVERAIDVVFWPNNWYEEPFESTHKPEADNSHKNDADGSRSPVLSQVGFNEHFNLCVIALLAVDQLLFVLLVIGDLVVDVHVSALVIILSSNET